MFHQYNDDRESKPAKRGSKILRAERPENPIVIILQLAGIAILLRSAMLLLNATFVHIPVFDPWLLGVIAMIRRWVE